MPTLENTIENGADHFDRDALQMAEMTWTYQYPRYGDPHVKEKMVATSYL